MTVPEASATVAVELERLRGAVSTGFAEVKGSLAVLVERSDRNEKDVKQLRQDTEKDVKQLRQDTEKDLAELRTDIEALKKSRWPLASIGALTGVAGVITGALALLAR